MRHLSDDVEIMTIDNSLYFVFIECTKLYVKSKIVLVKPVRIVMISDIVLDRQAPARRVQRRCYWRWLMIRVEL